MPRDRTRTAFLPAGLAFLAVGIAGPKAFVPIGLAFVVLGITGSRRRRRD